MNQHITKKAFISIVDPDLMRIFELDNEETLTMFFPDSDPMDINHDSEDPHYMTKWQAKKIVSFVRNLLEKQEKYMVLVNCRFGMCRSGAIAQFISIVAGLPFREQHAKNPQIVPNNWIVYRLFNEWFNASTENNKENKK